MGAVDNQPKAALSAKLFDTIVLSGIAPHAHEHHGTGSRPDLTLDILRVETEILIDVRENRLQPLIENDMVGRDERQRGRDDLVALVPMLGFLQYIDGEMEPARRRVEKMRVRQTRIVAPALFEFQRLVTRPGPAFLQA